MNQITDRISSFFRDSISIHEYDGFSSIDMPMLNWNSDFVRFYIEDDMTPGYLRLSDNRDTFEALASYLVPDKGKAMKWNDAINVAIERFGAVIDDQHEISMVCPKEKAGIACFMFGQALGSASTSIGTITEIERMEAIARKDSKQVKLSTIFKSDLDSHKCSYKQNYECKGKLVDHKFDFFVEGRQESLIRLLPSPTDSFKMLTMLEWQDVKKKDKDSKLYAISRDSGKSKTSIGIKIDKTMENCNIIQLSYEEDRYSIEHYILAS